MNVITSIIAHTRICESCQAEFIPNRASREQRWCSHSCANKTLAVARSDIEWTDERVAELTKLWDAGLSAGMISLKLYGTKTHRNAILGKLYRLKIPRLDGAERAARNRRAGQRRGKAIRQERQDRRKANKGCRISLKGRTTLPRRQAAVALPKPIPEPPPMGSKTLMELGLCDCRYPYGDKVPFLFCGLKVATEGSSWCLAHTAKVWTPLPPRKLSQWIKWR